MKLKKDLNDYGNLTKTNYKSPIKRHKMASKSVERKEDSKNNEFNNRNSINRNKNNLDLNYYDYRPRDNVPSSTRNNKNKKKNKSIDYNRIKTVPSEYSIDSNDRNNITTFKKFTTRNYDQKNNQKKKRHSSVKDSEDGKAKKYFYQLICKNCYNNKKATKNLKSQPLEQKYLLTKTFNKVNPYYFQDKMKDLQKDNINNKIKELENLQKQVLDKLAKYQIDNPTNKERLQKKNEYSINPFNSYEKEDPRFIKTQQAYDQKENFINNNRDLYQIDKPRKAINDYYNKCLYQVPILEEEYHVDPEYKKEVNNELKKQIEENKKNRKKKKDDDINDERIANQQMNDYLEFLDRKNKKDKMKIYEDYAKNNLDLDKYRKTKEEEEKKKAQKFENDYRKKLKEEDEEKRERERQKKLNDINKYQNWMEEFENEKNIKKKEEEKEKDKWNNYQIEYNNKCKHGLDIYRCAICNRIYPKDQLIKYYPTSTGSSMNSSKRTSFTK